MPILAGMAPAIPEEGAPGLRERQATVDGDGAVREDGRAARRRGHRRLFRVAETRAASGAAGRRRRHARQGGLGPVRAFATASDGRGDPPRASPTCAASPRDISWPDVAVQGGPPEPRRRGTQAAQGPHEDDPRPDGRRTWRRTSPASDKGRRGPRRPPPSMPHESGCAGGGGARTAARRRSFRLAGRPAPRRAGLSARRLRGATRRMPPGRSTEFPAGCPREWRRCPTGSSRRG